MSETKNQLVSNDVNFFLMGTTISKHILFLSFNFYIFVSKEYSSRLLKTNFNLKKKIEIFFVISSKKDMVFDISLKCKRL